MKHADGAFGGTARFTIIRCLGMGGMGVVYEAYDHDRRERVALKTLRQFDPAALYRFKHEFRALSETVHPHLIPLYELVGDGDQWFFTMELIDDALDLLSYVRPRQGTDEATPSHWATSSSSTITSAPGAAAGLSDEPTTDVVLDPPGPPGPPAFDLPRLRAGFRQFAEGVQALHAAGKLHRDLKPSNVLVTGAGQVVVLDFGLVANLAEAASEAAAGPSGAAPRVYHTTDQSLVGTVAFMSPEQASREPLTPASDWYAVGVMLFQALTGRLPFTGRGAAVMEAKRTREAPAPSALVTGIPPDLDALAVALLQRDPARRPSGAAVLTALGAAADRPAPHAEIFVGRAAHLRELTAAFDAMCGGRTVVCHVAGRSGAGKSTLVEHFLGSLPAAHGAVVLRGHCYEQESVPYKAIDSLVDALTHHLVGLPADELRRMAPPQLAELARVFPVFARVDALERAAGRGTAARDLRDVRRHAFAALRALLVALARRQPLVIHIDDLQWGDLDSAELLADLLRPPDAPHLLLVLSYRSEYRDSSPCLIALRSRAQTDGLEDLERRVDVDALAPDDAIALAAVLLGAERPQAAAEAAWVAREADGRPLFIAELAEHLRGGSPVGAGSDLDAIIWQRVTRLPDVARRLLEVVAVAGRPLPLVDAQSAATLPSLSSQVVHQLRAGRLVRTTGPSLQDEIETFHDRVRESVTAHLAPDTRRRHHGNLAATLEQSAHADPETLAAHFDGAGQSERALHYYEQAAAQAVHVLAFERAEALFARAAALAATDEARARIHERQIHFYTDLARFADAYAVGRRAVEPFGVQLPARFVPPLFAIDFLAARARLRGRTADDLLTLPPASDPRLETAVRLMNAVAKAAYQVKPELCVAVATKIVNLCLRHGNTPDCAIGYMVFGAIFHGGVLRRYRFGYDFGRLALALVERYGRTQQKAEVHFVVGYFGTSWLRPAREAEELWRVARDTGLQTGDLFHTGCACAGTAMSLFMRGVPLDTVWGETDHLLDVLRRHRLREPAGVVSTVRQAIRALRGETRAPGSFDELSFDERAFEADLATYGSRHFAHWYFIARMQTLYLFGDLEPALAMAARAGAYLKDSPGMLHSAEHVFYEALVHAALGRSRRRVARAAARFRRWAEGCPENFQARAELLEGEQARLGGRLEAAIAAFAAAEASAARAGHLQIQALAAWRGMRALSEAGRPGEATEARRRAIELWRRWGAPALAERVRMRA